HRFLLCREISGESLHGVRSGKQVWILGRLVRPGKVAYSSGWESRSGKAGQPPDREFRAGGSNPKG
ncbi:hypothetical protein, partial [Thiolapillus sp.]|uniref:hypothetical protein n=1 Tax=Thiolapillus sp. TaxID=2017437 RepID=UPI003AF7CFD3